MSDEQKDTQPQDASAPVPQPTEPEPSSVEPVQSTTEPEPEETQTEDQPDPQTPTEEEQQLPEPVYKSKLIDFDELKPGQTVRLHERIIDISPKGEERQRVQVFEGMIIGLRGSGVSRTLTIRKLSGGVAVEKIYPINSPVIAKIELVKTARVRRAKLTFLRNLKQRFKRKLKESYAKK